nr:PREDICTED: stAR-related lipid transfer protein 4 isoform X4 [Lepisosteus oculatus]
MGSLSDVSLLTTKLQNTLISYNSIEENEWRVAKKTVERCYSLEKAFRGIHWISGCCMMRYTTAGQLWNIIAPREFIDFSYTAEYKDGLLSCGVSIEYGELRQNYVRGFNHPCGWFCVPLEDSPDHSLLTGFIQTDLKGMLPQSAVDSAMASTLANFYTDLHKALKV